MAEKKKKRPEEELPPKSTAGLTAERPEWVQPVAVKNTPAIDAAVARAGAVRLPESTVKAVESAAPSLTRRTVVTQPAAEAAAQTAATGRPVVSEDLMDRILNRPAFSYNADADPLYAQYRRMYLDQGKIAAKDVFGQAAALTGGYGNTYAQGVAQQTYNDYAARAADKIPELYQLALDRYNREGDEARANYGLLYGREQDAAAAALAREKLDRSILESDRDYALNVAKFNETARQYDLTRADQREQFAAEMGLNYAKFDEDRRRYGLEYALEEAKTDASVAATYAGIANDNRKIGLSERELNMRENGTYFDQGSTTTKGSGTTGKTLTGAQRQTAANEALEMLNGGYSYNDVALYLEAQYGTDEAENILAMEAVLRRKQVADKKAASAGGASNSFDNWR